MNYRCILVSASGRVRFRLGLFPLILGVAILFATSFAGCSAPRAAASTPYWPTEGWRTSPPEAQGMDGALLDAMVQDVKEKRIPLYSLLVIRNGYIVSETYLGGTRRNTRREIYSVTKSFIATLAGIAVDRGELDPDTPVLECFPDRTFKNVDADKSAMTVRHLLTMTTGLDWTESAPTYRAMYMSGDWVGYVLDRPMRDIPGKEFLYCSGCSHLLAAVVQRHVGMDLEQYARHHLFEPLGIKAWGWDRDADGTPIGGWGLQLAPRDLAKLGYLYLRHGRWEEKQIVSEEWIADTTQRHVYTDGALGYGYQWWIYPEYGAYIALGRDGQTIFVIPQYDLVIVTTANLPGDHDEIFRLIEEYIVPAAEDVVQ